MEFAELKDAYDHLEISAIDYKYDHQLAGVSKAESLNVKPVKPKRPK